MRPAAQALADARADALARPAHGPEDRDVGERCILGFNAGPPVSPSAYNNNIHIFQTPGQVVILVEMVHDVRVIPWTAVRICPIRFASGKAIRAGTGRVRRS